MKITIVVDVFRAFTTASHVLEMQPSEYYLTNQCKIVDRLAKRAIDPLLIGKAEVGSKVEYVIPNSPTRVREQQIKGRFVVHRTAAGALGILQNKASDLILAACFANAHATAAYVKNLNPESVTVIPMGHEGKTESLEDTLCAELIRNLIQGKENEILSYHKQLKEGPGQYFFGKDQWQYPHEDFDSCVALRRFNFAIIARVEGEYAKLSTSEPILGA